MSIPREAAPAAGADLYRSFADPLRLRILNLLSGGPLCVNDLVAVLRVPQPTASRHLGLLRRSGVVFVERRGQWMFYSLPARPRPIERALLATLPAARRALPQLAGDAAALRARLRAGGCCPMTKAVRA